MEASREKVNFSYLLFLCYFLKIGDVRFLGCASTLFYKKDKGHLTIQGLAILGLLLFVAMMVKVSWLNMYHL